MSTDRRTVGCKAHALVADIVYSVVILQQRASHQVETIESVDQSLTSGSLASERPNAELGAGDGEVESLAS